MSTISRNIAATWWYTLSGVMVFHVMVVVVWLSVLLRTDSPPTIIIVMAILGLAWCGSCVLLLLQYRHRDDTAGPGAGWRGVIVPMALAVAFGAGCGILSGMWVIALLPVAQSLMTLNWAGGVRLRLLIVVTVMLAVLWFIDLQLNLPYAEEEGARLWGAFGFVSIALPSMTVLSLWWWDVLVSLDRARIAEARLSATQERLRVATDVHDLQGHHLQVIALQLELAERLLVKQQPEAALDQLRLARGSVTEARQGTRDLATRFRGVPLPDEIANAVDLLRAAGTTAQASLDPDAAAAPASVLGPVIRETTTNALKHGGGKWARLTLTRVGDAWKYEIANDAASDLAVAGDVDAPAVDAEGSGIEGSGIAGIARRVREAGGDVDARRENGEFTVIVTVPQRAVEDER